MEIRRATTSPMPIPTRGTAAPATGWYAATADVRPRAAVLRASSDAVERRATGVVVDTVRVAAGQQQQPFHCPSLPTQGVHPRGAPV